MKYYLRSRTNLALRPPLQVPESFNFAQQLKEALEVEIEKFEEGEAGIESAQDFDTTNTALVSSPSGSKTSPKHGRLNSYLDQNAPVTATAARNKRSFEAAFQHRAPDDVPLFQSASNRSHRRRSAKRKAKIIAQGHEPRADILRNILDESKPIEEKINLQELPATFGGYGAKHLPKEHKSKTPDSLESLKEKGFEYVPWSALESRPFITDEGVIFGAMVGHPKDPTFMDACERIYNKFEKFGRNPDLQEEALKNQRGSFPVLNVGVTHGKGTTQPINLHSPRKGKPSKHAETIDALLKDEDLNRIAAFGSASFQLWAPKVFNHYKTQLDRLYTQMPHLRRNFEKSVFPCAAINCGPNTWTYMHRDSMNCPYGFCTITALGRFDPKKGGHLILPDLKLVIEFPPGATILIPSATLVHGNIPVQEGDVRASFTQFCAGGLFRFVDNHFMTEKQLKKTNPTEYLRLMLEKPLRWLKGLDLLSKFDELVAITHDDTEE